MKTVLAASVMLSLGATPAVADVNSGSLRWYRGNTHTHTRFVSESDANETPENVDCWFKSHGYQFVVITDHEHLTDAGPLTAANATPGECLLVQG